MPVLTVNLVAAFRLLQPIFVNDHRIMMRQREVFDQRPLFARRVARDSSVCLPVSCGWH